MLHALKTHQVPAIGFVNEDKLLVNGEIDARVNLLREWLDTGMTLGNHGFGHLSLQKVPLDKAEAAVLKGEVITRWLTQQRDEAPHYYRYPCNQTGPTPQVRTEFVTFLKAHGYEVAPFTTQNDDFVYDKVHVYDLRHGSAKEAARVLQSYMAHLPVVMQVHETMTRELFGHQIPQIFDLHADSISAPALGAMLDTLQQRGYCFVSLEQALQDPAYDSPENYTGPYGVTWLRRWAQGRGDVKFSVYPPDPDDWITGRYDMIQKAEEAGSK